MAAETIIAWTDHTFNPWMGCVKVSDGCKHCYAEALTKNRMGLSLWGANSERQVTKAPWKNVVAWNETAKRDGVRRRVFCASLCDIFEDHPTAIATLPRVWDLIRQCEWLDWQLLTKRPHRIKQSLPAGWGRGWPHVWLGTSVEDMRVANRIDHLRKIPATVRFVSYEPAIGPLHEADLTGIDWVIQGGESGSGYRDMPIEWARQMKAKCEAEGVAYFFKQSAAWRTEIGIELDGEIVRNYPTGRIPLPLRI